MKNTLYTFKKLLFFLSAFDRKRLVVILLMIMIMALLDMIGVASILPFMAVLSNPEIIETNIFLKKVYISSTFFGVENNQQFIFFLGIFVFLLLIFSLTFKSLTTYLQVRFVQMCEYNLSKRLIEDYLHQPYSWFLGRNSADLGKNILSEVSEIIGKGLKPLMELIAKVMVVIALIFLLVLVDLKLTFFAGILFGGAYLIIFYFVRGYLHKIGTERLKNNQLRFTAVAEAFGAVKEVKVGGLEQIYIDRFSHPANNFAKKSCYRITFRSIAPFYFRSYSFWRNYACNTLSDKANRKF
jgi:ABC-type multidrug transport system fused ATPase/permease subunit